MSAAKAGVFIRPQIKTIVVCKKFSKKLNKMEKAAWNNFVAMVLGNHEAENYCQDPSKEL